MASIIQVSNETKASFTRNTKDGRHLTYELQVLQQPQRARACGSGAKSSADRRPVDPPPVVELKVLEGSGKDKTDITFSHNANFFLFTTLESARQIAPVRGASQQTPLPVLTGMPVSGMAYLDRPSQAGYFIFPDLSVRHEGKYRLSFNLFEELKEQKDMDMEPPAMDPSKMNGAANSHVHFRLEVKSEPFTVFSAKKFPGLAESTHLSRVVAEQGCRVRIRRDVRMRRREAKPSKDDDFDDFEGKYRDNRYTTPDTYPSHSVVERSRSVSNTSVDGNAHYPQERRPSVHEVAAPPSYYSQPAYHQQGPPPAPQSVAPTNYHQGHLSFGHPAPQYGAPPQPSPYAPATSPVSSTNPTPSATYQQYPPPPQPQQQQQSQQHAPHARQMSNSSNYSYTAPTQYHPQQQVPPPPQSAPQPAHQYAASPYQPQPEPEYLRRPASAHQPQSTSGYTTRPPSSSMADSNNSSSYYPAVDTRFANPPPTSSSSSTQLFSSPGPDPRSSTPVGNMGQGGQLPPLKIVPPTLDAHRKYDVPSSAVSASGSHMGLPPHHHNSSASTSPQPQHQQPQPVGNGTYDPAYPAYPTVAVAAPSSAPANPSSTPTSHHYSSGYGSSGPVHGGKRSFGKVFDQSHLSGSSVGGARPEVSGQDVLQVECDGQLIDDDDELISKMLTYRRADGTRQHKKIPSPV